ncbi:SulP family inorganic anion transporter [Dyella solisilvae]|uniref:SulP family inorganic anion transporter n=1 Tax=Dyella solisilvae TaxID=1920168 RepID=A0A370KD67_9GAMM|nr:SulP family inorganic anion transporter [Dyella solisilvae]RDJ00502.1 SulP family inorganic anion transporter [Dyella solisilvae]
MPQPLLQRLIPGLAELLRYQRGWLRTDLQAGLSVAAVALPINIAYAQLAGFSPLIGLYSAVLPMIVYALFGSSRQMIVGPDAATCAMLGATLMPLAAPGSDEYQGYAMALTLMTGVMSVVASRFHLGFLADFLSRPILIGLLNGVAVTILVSQSGKALGITLGGGDTISQVHSLLAQLAHIHWPTALLSAGTLVAFLGLRLAWPRGPAALIALAGAGLASWMFRLAARGVDMVGALPSGLPPWVAPSLPHALLGTLVPAAGALTLITFSSGMFTSRAFAARNGYHVDGDQEFFALGLSHLASAACQGFPVSGSSSRTAVNETSGGKSRLVSIVAALVILLVPLYLTGALAMLPHAALSTILLATAAGLIDLGGLRELRRFSRGEHLIALMTVAGVVLFGVMSGILLAVTIALLRFLSQVTRPTEQLFGLIDGQDGFYELAHYPQARAISGLLIYRFESPLTFFNADYFRRRIQHLCRQEQPRWVVVDAISMTKNDITGLHAIDELQRALQPQGIQLVIAGRTQELVTRMTRAGLPPARTGILYYPSRQAALVAYRERFGEGSESRAATTDETSPHG